MHLDNLILSPPSSHVFTFHSHNVTLTLIFPCFRNIFLDFFVTSCYNSITFAQEVLFMADENAVLMYKGRPLMRKDNLVYYGSMADSHIIQLQILETKKVGDMDVATRVSVQLQLTDPAAKSRDRIVKKSEKDGFYTALDVGCVWLERALAGK